MKAERQADQETPSGPALPQPQPQEPAQHPRAARTPRLCAPKRSLGGCLEGTQSPQGRRGPSWLCRVPGCLPGLGMCVHSGRGSPRTERAPSLSLTSAGPRPEPCRPEATVTCMRACRSTTAHLRDTIYRDAHVLGETEGHRGVTAGCQGRLSRPRGTRQQRSQPGRDSGTRLLCLLERTSSPPPPVFFSSENVGDT